MAGEHHGGAHHDHSHHGEQSPLGFADVVAGGVLFILLAFVLNWALGAVVPGLLKWETLVQVIISGAIFVVFWALVGNYVFKPFLDTLLEREERTVGDERRALEMARESRDIEHKIEEYLRLARLEALGRRDQLVEEARQRAQKVQDAAARGAEERLHEAQAEIAAMKEGARRELEQEASKLADLVIDRALAAEPGPIMH